MGGTPEPAFATPVSSFEFRLFVAASLLARNRAIITIDTRDQVRAAVLSLGVEVDVEHPPVSAGAALPLQTSVPLSQLLDYFTLRTRDFVATHLDPLPSGQSVALLLVCRPLRRTDPLDP